MNKIIVYEQFNFQGQSREFTSDVANLCDCDFDDCISSLKVIGNPWVAFRDINFIVPLAVYEEGEYAQVKNLDTISSLQLVTEDLSNPQITLYEDANFMGKSLVITCETSLSSGSFNDVTSSHKVQRGAWALYENSDQTGKLMVARAGRDVPYYQAFNDCLSYLHPLKPGKVRFKAVLLWDKKQDSVNSVTTHSLCCLNSSDEIKPFCRNLKRTFEAFISESFNFTSAAGIVIGAKFDLDLSVLKKVYDLAVKDIFTVEKGINNTRTEKKPVEVHLPASVPPYTRLIVNVVTKEVNLKIPVQLIFDKIEINCGEYVCYSEMTLTTEIKKEPLYSDHLLPVAPAES